MSRQTPGWNAEYADLESETQALLNSVRKGPPGAAPSSPKKSAAKKKRGSVSSNGGSTPKRRGRKRGGRATPKSGRSRSKSRQRRDRSNSRGMYDAVGVDEAPSEAASSAGPDDSFAGLIATATMNSTTSTLGGSPHNAGGRRRRRRSSKDMSNSSSSSSLHRHGRSTNLEDSVGSEGGFSEIEPPASDRSSGTESGGSPTAGESKRSSPAGHTANAGDSVESAAAKEQQERLEALERARAEEAKLRELSFRAEESRVREGLDGFIPHKVTQVAKAVKELDAEKARLNELEGKMKAGGQQRLDNLRRRDRRVAEVHAATDIQRIVRGKFGRKRAHIKRKQMEMEAAGISLLPPLHPELPGPDPRDFGPSETPESGANTTNIDMDDQGYLVGGGGSRLPQLNFSSGKGGGGRLKSFKVGNRRGDGPGRPFSASSSISSASSTASSDLDLDEAIPVERTPRLFLPDGSPDIKLRDTVRNALRVSRFDSVSTLLASGPLARKVKKGKDRMEKKGGVRKATVDRVKGMHTPYRSGSGDQIGSPGKQKNGGKFVATVKSSAADAQSSGVMSPSQKGKKGKKGKAASGMSGPPAMYEVSHGGFDTGERTVDPNADDTASEADSDAGGAIVKKGGSSKKTKGRKKKQVCFACWSAGDDMVKRCDLHEDDENAPDDGRDDSILMCGNWNVHALRRRYRAEELQEVFAKAVSSLRWDLNRKQFVTVIECRHPIYRMINGMLELLNKRKSRMDHARAWFKSILEDLRAGKIKGLSEKQKQKSKMLAAKDSMMNFAWTQRYAREVRYTRHPKAPVTATEMSGLVGAAELRRTQHHGLLIVAPPTPVPVALYRLRVYELPEEVFVRVPKPSHSFSPYEGEESAAKGFMENRYIVGDSPNAVAKAYVEMLAQTWSAHAVDQACAELYQSAPPVEKYRTKYPRAVTVKYSTFGRKPVRRNMAMGGLSALAILSQKVTTLIPPQYGNFVVIDRRSIAPKLRENVSADFPTLQPWDPPPPCSCRAVVSALDTRYVPTVTVSASAEGRPKPAQGGGGAGGPGGQIVEDAEGNPEVEPSNPDGDLAKIKAANMVAGVHFMENWTGCIRLYHGDNRPEQTGEADYTGFATTSYTPGLLENKVLDSTGFTPSVDVAVPNKAGNHGTVCSQADINYPFCVPSTRPNTMYDFYELLVNDKSSSNQACCFTVLGKQDPGDFGVKNNMKGKFGPLVTRVYRSYGYMQHLDDIEEFKTPEGISYWYNARTGETVWEKPLALEDGYLDSDDEDEIDPTAEESKSVSYSENKMRKHLLADYEAQESDMDAALKENEKGTRLNLGSLAALPGPQIAKNPMSGRGELPPVPAAFQPTPRGFGGDTARSRQGDAALVRQTDPSGKVSGHKALPNPTPRLPGTPRLHSMPAPAATNSGVVVPALPISKSSAAAGAMGGGAVIPSSSSTTAKPVQSIQHTAPKPQFVPQQSAAAQQQDMLNFFTQALQNVMPALQQQAGAAGGAQDSEKMLRLGLGLGLGIAMQGQQKMQGGNSAGQQQQQQQQRQIVGAASGMARQQQQRQSMATTTSMVSKGSSGSSSKVGANKIKHVLPQATPPPDEQEEMERRAPVASNVVVREHKTHPPATEMVTFQPVGGEKKTRDAPIKRSAASLPEGFIASVFESHTGKQHVDYLPAAANLNVPREAGVVRPNNISEVWEKAGYDPWSAGKDPYATVFVPSLNFEEEDVADVPDDEMADKAGLTKFQLEQKQANKEAEDLKYVFSKARHGQYSAIEEKFDEPEWTVDIDATDATGATLLHIACQNGNRRIAKFCLRKGADINKPNLAGNTPLHFSFAYGFEDLGEYLMDKGADDSLTNSDGLTCYEGLNMESVEQI